MSRTQLLLQITEKDAVTDGLRVIERTAHEGVKQVRRIEEFIGEGERLNENEEESLIDIIEDAIEFAKIQFKVEEKEKRRFIKIARKYYARFIVNTDVRLMRELLLSVIFKVAGHISARAAQVEFKDNGSPVSRYGGKKDERRPMPARAKTSTARSTSEGRGKDKCQDNRGGIADRISIQAVIPSHSDKEGQGRTGDSA
jgi:hypothetical protein